jgi:hypothetical protein
VRPPSANTPPEEKVPGRLEGTVERLSQLLRGGIVSDPTSGEQQGKAANKAAEEPKL